VRGVSRDIHERWIERSLQILMREMVASAPPLSNFDFRPPPKKTCVFVFDQKQNKEGIEREI
jgi:hypothetical protein